MKKQLTNVKIKINVGNITVEIEAPIDKIEEAVKNTLAAIKAAEPPKPVREEASRKPVTCKKAVAELIDEGWMHSGKTLAEVSAELARRGFSYDTTAVAHVLLELVREGVLERVGEPRRYVYRTRGTTLKTSQTTAEDSTK